MDYSNMSDFEINKSVALALGFRLYKDGKSCRGNHVAIKEGGCGAFAMDWCNNPADAWPIVLSNKIGINPGTASDKWAAHYCNWDIATADANPLRAAMIVFLTMQESK